MAHGLHTSDKRSRRAGKLARTAELAAVTYPRTLAELVTVRRVA
jgi:hypothetical protein